MSNTQLDKGSQIASVTKVIKEDEENEGEQDNPMVEEK